ncbi:MAG: hypothetical protein NTZ63_02060 [Candidatus Omnitrophica bacterium]|nr:hypothetical protein [Candidatus Omnitrophota bacterium]
MLVLVAEKLKYLGKNALKTDEFLIKPKSIAITPLIKGIKRPKDNPSKKDDAKNKNEGINQG